MRTNDSRLRPMGCGGLLLLTNLLQSLPSRLSRTKHAIILFQTRRKGNGCGPGQTGQSRAGQAEPWRQVGGSGQHRGGTFRMQPDYQPHRVEGLAGTQADIEVG